MNTKRSILLLICSLVVIAAVLKVLGGRSDGSGAGPDEVEEWGKESFPASDPPSHW